MDKNIYILGSSEIPSSIVLDSGRERSDIFMVPGGVNGCMDVTYELIGEGASLDVKGIYVCRGDQDVDIRITVKHLCGNCVSHQLFKGIALDKAKVNFEGLVYVASGAEKTEALQENHSLLLSEGALVQSQPQLEIYADDVICSHGATVGSLDEEEQFYMRSRGISLSQARRLQIISFLSPVVADLPQAYVDKVYGDITL
mgnify:FL=1